MSQSKPSISIMFPFLNDWGTVGSLLALSISTVQKLTDDWEVVVVNDGSQREDREALGIVTDVMLNSFQHLKIPKSPQMRDPAEAGQVRDDKELKLLSKRIKIIDHEKNRGYGGALRSGFNSASKDLIFYTDCDAQYDPRELALLYEKLKPGVGMVNGFKIKRNDPWFRIVAGRVYHHLAKFAFGLPIRDTDCDFRLIRREVFQKVKLYENTGTICVELVAKIDHAGYKIAEVPVHHFWRTSGKSQFFNFLRVGKTGLNLFRLWWKLMIRKEYFTK